MNKRKQKKDYQKQEQKKKQNGVTQNKKRKEKGVNNTDEKSRKTERERGQYRRYSNYNLDKIEGCLPTRDLLVAQLSSVQS